MLLERLIVNRPHPWGLLITFIELIKNPRCAPPLVSVPPLCQLSTPPACQPARTNTRRAQRHACTTWRSCHLSAKCQTAVFVLSQTGTAFGRTRSRTARRRSTACSSRSRAAAWARPRRPSQRRTLCSTRPSPCARSRLWDLDRRSAMQHALEPVRAQGFAAGRGLSCGGR